MEIILLVFVGVICIGQGVRVCQAEKTNKVFCKYPLVVKDVKEYNRFCGSLMIGFGIVAELTLLGVFCTRGLISLLLCFLLLLEAFVVMKIYNKNEKRFRK